MGLATSKILDSRVALDRLIRESRDDYTSISRLLGRNAAYIQQYIKRGTPLVLREDDRAVLARYFGVDESVLGGPKGRTTNIGNLEKIPSYAIAASAGFGATVHLEQRSNDFAFGKSWLSKLTPSNISNLSIINVVGDSMEPTLQAGDDIIIDLGDGAARLRDGLYVVRTDDLLSVKRIAMEAADGKIAVISDNPVYPRWNGIARREIDIVGRVLWFGRRL
jgi:hypothetical protein